MTISFEKLVKLLRMTEGSHDGEVLNAIRMANDLLMKENINWEELIFDVIPAAKAKAEAHVKQSNKPEPVKYTNKDEINTYFQNIFNGRLGGSFKVFVTSVHEFWENYEYLTEKQYNAIKKAGTRTWSNVE